MTSPALEDRVTALEEAARANRLPVEARVAELEAQVKALKPKQKDGWEKLQALSGILTALVTIAVGYLVTGSVNQALERRKLESANVEKMRDLITKFNDANVSEADAEALGLTLAAFGEFAVPPLIAALGTNTQKRSAAAEKALLAVGLTDAKPVCLALTNVLNNRTRLYTRVMHQRTIRLLGHLECRRAAKRALTDYASLMQAAHGEAGLKAYAMTLDEELIDPSQVDDMRAALCATPQLRAQPVCAAPPGKAP